jgi:hypothetical protein
VKHCQVLTPSHIAECENFKDLQTLGGFIAKIKQGSSIFEWQEEELQGAILSFASLALQLNELRQLGQIGEMEKDSPMHEAPGATHQTPTQDIICENIKRGRGRPRKVPQHTSGPYQSDILSYFSI